MVSLFCTLVANLSLSNVFWRRMTSSGECVLKTTFPPRVLDDHSASLLEYGLVPTGTVYVAKKRI